MPRQNANVKALIEENSALKEKVDELHRLMSEQKSFINSSLEVRKDTEQQPVMVPVKNYSGSHFTYTYTYRGQDKRLELEPIGPRQVGSLPFEVWAEIERDGRHITAGRLVRTDVPNNNPNCFDDIPMFINKSKSATITDRIRKVTTRGVLSMMLQYLDTIPDKEKTANQLTAYNAIKTVMLERFNIQLIDEE